MVVPALGASLLLGTLVGWQHTDGVGWREGCAFEAWWAALPRRSQAHKIAPPAPLAGCGAAGRMSLSGTSLRPTCQCRHMTAGLWANVLAGEGMLKALRESAGDCGCQGREAVVVLLSLLSW